MGKYLIHWEVDMTRAPANRQEIGVGWSVLLDIAKQDLQKGRMKDWGIFVGEVKGYLVVEGSEVEVNDMLLQYTPFVQFEAHAVASVSQAYESVEALSK